MKENLFKKEPPNQTSSTNRHSRLTHSSSNHLNFSFNKNTAIFIFYPCFYDIKNKLLLSSPFILSRFILLRFYLHAFYVLRFILLCLNFDFLTLKSICCCIEKFFRVLIGGLVSFQKRLHQKSLCENHKKKSLSLH